jgi:hypothetical protein
MLGMLLLQAEKEQEEEKEDGGEAGPNEEDC